MSTIANEKVSFGVKFVQMKILAVEKKGMIIINEIDYRFKLFREMKYGIVPIKINV